MKSRRRVSSGYGFDIILFFAAFFLFVSIQGIAGAKAEDLILPVINIISDTPYDNVTDEYAYIRLEITSDCMHADMLYNGSAYIHLRGNSTSKLEKKPFRLKLEKKADLFGFGESRHWVLLANAIDLTNIRNYSIQQLAGKLGLDHMDSQLVELYYNGDYKGVYELCEHVRIGKNRVKIYDWSELAEDVAEAVTDGLIEKGVFTEGQKREAADGISSDLKRDYAWVTAADKHYYLTTVRTIAGRDHWNVDLSEYYDFSEVPAANGGALIEMDFYHNGNADLKTAYRLPLYITSPDLVETPFVSLEENLREYIQAMEYAMHSTDFVYRNSDRHYYTTGEGRYSYSSKKRSGATYFESDFSSAAYDGLHYKGFVNIDSVVNNMLVCEISDNWDCMKNSFFMYKDVGSKLVFGPVWDFDWAWGNSMYNIDTAGLWRGIYTYARTWQTTNDYFANEQYYQTQQFNRLLIRDPYFVVKLYERYHEVRESIILPFAEEFASMCETMNDYNTKNYRRWAATDSSGGSAGHSYKEQLINTQKFLEERITWLDEQFSDIDSLMTSLGYYKASDCLTASAPDFVSSPGNALIGIEVSGSIAKDTAGISFQINGDTFAAASVNDGIAEITIPLAVFADEPGSLSTVVFRAVGSDGKYIDNPRGTEKGVYANVHSNFLVIDEREWTVPVVSDDSPSSVEPELSVDDVSDADEKSVKTLLIHIAVIVSAIVIGACIFIKHKKNKM